MPCSATNTESTIIPAKLSSVWEKFRWWKLEQLAPGIVSSTQWIDGAAGRVDSTVKITYTNGAIWHLRVTELSEKNHSLSYELV